MGLYATLIGASVNCPNCGLVRTDDWQFQFGDVHDLPEYQIGDSIKWSRLQCYGFESMREVYAVAYHVTDDFCPGCTPSILGQIVIIDGKINALDFLEVGHHKREIFYEGSERSPYYISEKRRGRVSNEK